MVVELFGIDDADRMRAALAIRTTVFVDEQGVPPEEEVDEHDRTDRAAVHALARDSGDPDPDFAPGLGAARFYVVDATTVQIGRMAVLPAARGRGVGAALLRALVTEARRRGYRHVHLHAQTHATTFYRKAGFSDDGALMWDAGIEHQPMSLLL